MSVFTATGSVLSIGGVHTSSIDTLAEYQALSWQAVGETEDLGEFGDEASIVPFTALSDARVRKSKGSRDAGDMEVVVGSDFLDGGQQALLAAEATAFTYAFKLEFPDAQSEDYTNTIAYFGAKVTSARVNAGQANNIVRTRPTLAITTPIVWDYTHFVS